MRVRNRSGQLISVGFLAVFLIGSNAFSQAEEKISCSADVLQKFIAFANADVIKTFAQSERIKESWVQEKSRDCFQIPAVEKAGYRLKILLEPTLEAPDAFKAQWDRCGVTYSFYVTPRIPRLPKVRRYAITAEPECGLE